MNGRNSHVNRECKVKAMPSVVLLSLGLWLENQAKEQASKLIESAQLAIQNEKNSAMNELKQTVVELSVGIAEKVISSELEDKSKQLKVVENMLNDASLNN